MSQLERQKEERTGKKGRKPTGPAKKANGPLVSFSPNEPQKLAVKVLRGSPERVLDAASQIVARGVKITLGYIENSDAYYAIAREVSDDWQSAKALSAVHKDVLTALASLVYCCEDVYPGFPDCEIAIVHSDLDW